jgi:drug/metabolite transporter (DMT)-like permease
MSARTEGILMLVVMVALSAVFQVQVKLVAGQVGTALARQDPGLLGIVLTAVRAMISWRGVLMVGLAGFLFLLWLLALTKLELSYALPLVSISLIVTAIGGGMFLGESLTVMRVGGLLLTAAGIWMVLRT